MFPVLSANGQSGYNLTKSLRFRGSASAYLNRTPSSTGNRKTWTYSVWFKRGALGGSTTKNLLTAFVGSGSNIDTIDLYNDNIRFFFNGSSNSYLVTSQVLRDPSAWYHLVAVVDTTQATSSNRMKLYLNGLQITSFSTATYPSLNYDTFFNLSSYPNIIGNSGFSSDYFDGYMAEVNFIDGQALAPSSFGTNNSITGVWQPAKYTGTYGTNGFYLPFTDTTSTTTLGYDFSGNSNNWTTNNISLTAGSTYDSMTDVPTLTSATTANYAVLNPLKNGGTAPSNANLRQASTADNTLCLSTIGMTTGKFYWEFVNTSSGGSVLGIATDSANLSNYLGATINSWGYHQNALIYTNATSTAYGNSWTVNDVMSIAFDADTGKLFFAKNGVWQNSGDPTAGTNPAYSSLTFGPYFPAVQTNNTAVNVINFGQQPFTYTPPTGFVALNTYNLPDSTIVAGNTVMDATIWTGNGSDPRTITNAAGFKPDLVWAKLRSGAASNTLYDSVRGVGNVIYSDLTAAEANNNPFGYLTSFNSNGFSATAGSTSNAYFNANGSTYVGWQWQAGQGTTSSNTSGSITSTVSVNASAGFSIVRYTIGALGGGTIGHGLGVAPKFIINKVYDRTENWRCYNENLGNTKAIYLNTTAASTTDGVWGNTSPTSSVFTIGTGYFSLNDDCIAYCWSEVAGFSKFGSYTGNGSSDGPFIYTGFRPKFLIIKRTDSSGYWYTTDSVRDTYNPESLWLLPNASNAETSFVQEDFLSNGFKLRTTNTDWNGSGGTYIYMAFAENPFKNSLAR